ncbi:sulfate adenylyltransferase subunit 1 [Microbacterium sp.]|uniref:sulfate adenylyltransferase subunit 1 n=1 Tax=Microbacterium sp. TaxID=51671 RepID=UPI002811BAFA|nr:GTP-binding protein [Microbacterium sp.]
MPTTIENGVSSRTAFGGARSTTGEEGALDGARSTTGTTGTLFRFATAGSVDDGKSTLVGRLLHDAKAILSDQLEQVARTSAERGFAHGEFDFALLTDGLRAEREQGITIDVAYRYLATDRRTFILADCPGHVQYTRNMVTGAATADAVVVLVDVRKGVVEQTRRHLAVASLLRVPNVILAVNKIDLADYDEQVFRAVEADAQAVARELGLDGAHVIPVSALQGDNVAEVSERTPWYDGPALLELLETLPTESELEGEQSPFRLPVQTVIRPQGGLAPGEDAVLLRDYRGYAGRIASGTIRVGDAVEVFPGGHVTTVTGIRVAGRETDRAQAADSVSVTLADDLDAARGAVIAAAGTAPRGTREAELEIFQLDSRPLIPGDQLLVKHGTAIARALITDVLSRRDLETLDQQRTAELRVNDIGRVRIRFAAELPLERYADDREAGALLLIHAGDGATLAAATVITAG